MKKNKLIIILKYIEPFLNCRMQLEDIQTLKIIVVGETNVGKSSLIRKIITGKFDDKTVSLIENIETRFLH